MVVIERLLPGGAGPAYRKFAAGVHIAEEHIGHGVAALGAGIPGFKNCRNMLRRPSEYRAGARFPARAQPACRLAATASSNCCWMPGKSSVAREAASLFMTTVRPARQSRRLHLAAAALAFAIQSAVSAAVGGAAGLLPVMASIIDGKFARERAACNVGDLRVRPKFVFQAGQYGDRMAFAPPPKRPSTVHPPSMSRVESASGPITAIFFQDLAAAARCGCRSSAAPSSEQRICVRARGPQDG